MLKEEYRNSLIVGYISKCLQLAPQGKYLSQSLDDMFQSLDNVREERPSKSAKEIVEDVAQKAGLKIVNGS